MILLEMITSLINSRVYHTINFFFPFVLNPPRLLSTSYLSVYELKHVKNTISLGVKSSRRIVLQNVC